MTDHVQPNSSNFVSNQKLKQQAHQFGNFLNTRSQYDQKFLTKYDPLSLNTDTGPSNILNKKPNWVTGTFPIVERYFTAEKNIQKPYSQCGQCDSIHCAQRLAGAPGCPTAKGDMIGVLGPGGRSRYDMNYDKRYESLSLHANTNFAGTNMKKPNWVTGTFPISGQTKAGIREGFCYGTYGDSTVCETICGKCSMDKIHCQCADPEWKCFTDKNCQDPYT